MSCRQVKLQKFYLRYGLNKRFFLRYEVKMVKLSFYDMAMLKAMLKYSFYDMKGTVNTKNSFYDMALVQRMPQPKNM